MYVQSTRHFTSALSTLWPIVQLSILTAESVIALNRMRQCIQLLERDEYGGIVVRIPAYLDCACGGLDKS